MRARRSDFSPPYGDGVSAWKFDAELKHMEDGGPVQAYGRQVIPTECFNCREASITSLYPGGDVTLDVPN